MIRPLLVVSVAAGAAFAGLASACSGSDNGATGAPPDSWAGVLVPDGQAPDGQAPDGGAPPDAGDCTPGDGGLPDHLGCTGLYSDIGKKTISDDVHPYTPGVQLWSDGADKQRYLYLPKGQTIDTSDMDEWVYPVGTKVWKEFRVGGARIETRIFSKVSDYEWAWTTYRWNGDESDAVRLDDGATNVVGSYEIPNHDACSKCHQGRKDMLLGIEAVSLSLPTAQGVTLDVLANQWHALSQPPANTHANLPEDATKKAASALGFLHMNCGVACHNGNNSAGAHLGDFYMRLPAQDVLAGTAQVKQLDVWTTGANKPVQSTDYLTQKNAGYQRIIPGNAGKSLIDYVVNLRGKGQMPPIISHQVDKDAVSAIEDWINAE